MIEKKYSKSHIGKEFITNEGYKLRVIDGGSRNHYCTIQINDWISEMHFSSVKRGQVKYPYHTSILNKGYMGIGSYSSKSHRIIYDKWNNMMKKCYSEMCQGSHTDIEVCDEWLNFQNFARWYERYCPKDGLKYVINKDLLKGKSKIYSPQTCIFIHATLDKFMVTMQSDNTSGYMGVSWNNSVKKWQVCIRIDGIRKHLGKYRSIDEASRAYQQVREEQVNRWKRYYNFDYPKDILNNLK
jgi:hypothetical protein